MNNFILFGNLKDIANCVRLFRWEVGGYDDAAQIGQYVRIEVQGLGSKLPPAGTAGTKSNRIKEPSCHRLALLGPKAIELRSQINNELKN